MEILTVLLLIGGVIWFWAESMRVREHLLEIVRRACKEMDAQLLDETVVVRRIRLARGDRGWPTLLRTYQFEFTLDGFTREQGSATLLGNRLLHLQLDIPGASTIIPPEDRALRFY
ncbi:MAG: DUF3301 domain-containing protein [Gammaproteobacteria bacterium]|nr:MAG: DUF3301 domain-containing protein [Gammaproteobacteria bacterium]